MGKMLKESERISTQTLLAGFKQGNWEGREMFFFALEHLQQRVYMG
jgi:hypothetical protein